jgi:hypothetical protein
MSLDLTGIQNIGEFYSHHYLDTLLENDLKGLFAKWREGDEATPERHLFRMASEYFKAKSQARPELSPESRFEPSHRIHVTLLEALCYPYTFELRYLSGKLAVPVLSALQRDGHAYLWIVETPFPGRDELMDADTSPFDQRLFRRQYPPAAAWGEADYVLPEVRWEDLIGDIFHTDEPPRWLLLFAGRFIYLVDRTKWGRGQYLLFDLDEILSRRQTQTLRATATLLSREALCPDDGVPLHDTLDENSHKHAYGVSSDLKYGLRRAVELLANEYVWFQRNVARGALFQDEALAHKLTDEALTYLYRLLFLLYAEARGGELDVVPVKAEAYLKGYSLEALRDLEQVPLTTPQAQNGYYINDSLNRLFTLVDEGHSPQQLELISEISAPITGYDDYSFRIKGLHSPLFNRQSTPLLSSVRFRNSVLQEVIQLLSLSKEKKGKKFQRGRISYAHLGINQLGAVYEALLSYSGFFATERLYEVKPAEAKEADETAQTYFVPESELERYLPEEFVYDSDTGQRKSYEKGSFVFRLAGRDREKSASYYTPEVLTQCVVKYSLKELLKDKTADDILKITICEPAMGSGAFINEALNQLSDAYLERKQKELGKRIPPDDYRTERQKVKYYLAVNNAYGVDLNPTAVRLAEVSLWLNIQYPDSPTPWFGARLATGNSLIGARRQVYTTEQVKSGAYASQATAACPLTSETPEDREAGRIRPRPEGTIYHWLLPDAGMAAFDKDKVIKELAPAEVEAIKAWRKEFTKPFTAAEIKNLLVLSNQADAIWQKALDERRRFLENTYQPTPVWGQSQDSTSPNISIEQLEKELTRLQRPTGPLARLKLAMDYWCALWFWSISEAGKLPTRKEFLKDFAAIFSAGEDSGFESTPEQLDLFETPKPTQTHFGDIKSFTINDLVHDNPRLGVVRQVAGHQQFHHWELTFSEAFTQKDGFDVILGNPPWVLLNFDEPGLLSDFSPIIALRKLSAAQVTDLRGELLSIEIVKTSYIQEYVEQTGGYTHLSSPAYFPYISGLKSNLYLGFINRAWNLGSQNGIIGFLHPEGIYDFPDGGKTRSEVYGRLKYHFQFVNELKLFAEVHHQTRYSVNIYNPQPTDVAFESISNLYHPITIDQCYQHDGMGNIPGIQDENGDWNKNGHKLRIVNIKNIRLELFASLYDLPGTSAKEARLPAIHSEYIVTVLERFAEQKKRMADVQNEFSVVLILDETKAQKDGVLKSDVRYPKKPNEWVLSGPHIYVGTPLYKTPNEGCKNNLDYGEIDLLEIPDDYMPRTNYIPALSESEFRERLPVWQKKSVLDYYRHVHRRMLGPTSERTLICAIIPPGVSHTYSTSALCFSSLDMLCKFNGLSSSLPYDFLVKSTGRTNLVNDLIMSLPFPEMSPSVTIPLIARTLRLNCVTVYYSELWHKQYSPNFNLEKWSIQDKRLSSWDRLLESWNHDVALRNQFERRQALIEIDVLAAMALDLTLDELITIYRVQFPVLQKNERRLLFDQRGTEVPMKTVGGELGPDENHPKFPEMVPPFTPVDREEGYRVAWKFFEERLTNEKGKVQ